MYIFIYTYVCVYVYVCTTTTIQAKAHICYWNISLFSGAVVYTIHSHPRQPLISFLTLQISCAASRLCINGIPFHFMVGKIKTFQRCPYLNPQNQWLRALRWEIIRVGLISSFQSLKTVVWEIQLAKKQALKMEEGKCRSQGCLLEGSKKRSFCKPPKWNMVLLSYIFIHGDLCQHLG